MAIDLKLIDKLLADYKKPEDIIGENGLLKQLTKAFYWKRAMQAEMTEHLGYSKHDPLLSRRVVRKPPAGVQSLRISGTQRAVAAANHRQLNTINPKIPNT